MSSYRLNMKRVYEKAEKEDGYRILVDRMWPRGVSKENASIDDWVKEITPTTAIRKEFNHQPQKFEWFKKVYLAELESNPDTKSFVKQVFEQLKRTPVTFVYAAKDEQFNHVVVLMEFAQNQK